TEENASSCRTNMGWQTRGRKLSGVSSRGDMQRKPQGGRPSFHVSETIWDKARNGRGPFRATNRICGSHPAPEEVDLHIRSSGSARPGVVRTQRSRDIWLLL